MEEQMQALLICRYSGEAGLNNFNPFEGNISANARGEKSGQMTKCS